MLTEKELLDMNTKEKIMHFAKDNPFRNIEQIAELSETTVMYVRTTLSEADFSLMEMRKKEYERLKRDYEELKQQVGG